VDVGALTINPPVILIAVLEANTFCKLFIELEALFTISAPPIDIAVEDANTFWRLFIVLEAVFTSNPPLTLRKFET
jgi:hypothetical protein